MYTSCSPTINMLTEGKLRADNSFGYVTYDCDTVVASLPSGTQIIPTKIA